MASTEEVLSTLLADDYIHSSIQFLIDENMRTVTVPPEGVVLGVTGDKDVNRINFKMVRFYDGLDLSTFQIRINYVNANGDANYYQVTDTTVEEDSILFTWLVSSDAAAYKGTVSFAARLYTVEDTNVKESFNSTVATAEVLEGIIVDEYMPPDAQQDLIALLMSQIDFPAGSNVGQVDANSAGTGEIFNNYDKNKAPGSNSHAEGIFTTASGLNSHAEGERNTASGESSHAEGRQTIASGQYSHAEGAWTTASGNYQHVQGVYNIEDSTNTYAMIIGNGVPDWYHSNAFTVDWNGNIQCGKTDSSGNFTAGTINGVDVTQISGGSGSGVGQVDTTEGSDTHGEIFNDYEYNEATGLYSHAEGFTTTASGSNSHAEGNDTIASGMSSHAEGSTTEATGNFTHAEGLGTKASSTNQHVQGRYNIEDSAGTYAMIIGNGTANDARSNALTVDWSGNIECGTVNGVDVTQISGGGVGQIDSTSGAVYHGEIFNGYPGSGYANSATGQYSHAEGQDTEASGNASHAEGQFTIASGAYSHAEGGTTKATGGYSHAEGYSCKAKGSQGSHAEGNGTEASGQSSHAEGQETTASAQNSHAEGYQTTASGVGSHTEGNNTKAGSVYQHVQGKFNVVDATHTYAMIIGNGTADGSRSNALTVDWNGNIQCGKTDTSGNFTTNGTINGVDIVALAARVAALEGTS